MNNCTSRQTRERKRDRERGIEREKKERKRDRERGIEREKKERKRDRERVIEREKKERRKRDRERERKGEMKCGYKKMTPQLFHLVPSRLDIRVATMWISIIELFCMLLLKCRLNLMCMVTGINP
jgi:hypothetical protein